MVFVSYIVATFNAIDDIPTLNQTILDIGGDLHEFCIADGGSDDGTTAAIEQSPVARIVRSEPDSGIYDAWNKALPFCRGEYVAFIGADDCPSATFLGEAKKVVSCTDNPPLFIYGDRVLARQGYTRYLRSPKTPSLFEAMHPIFDVPHQGALHHRSLFDQGTFDATYSLAGDLEFLLRYRHSIQANYHYIAHPQVVAGAEGVSRQPEALSAYLREYRRIENDHRIRLGYRRYLLRMMSQFRHFPRLFALVRGVSWALHHER